MIQKTPCRQVPGAKVMVVVCRPARVCSCCSRVPGHPRERFMPGPALRSTSCRASVHHDATGSLLASAHHGCRVPGIFWRTARATPPSHSTGVRSKY